MLLEAVAGPRKLVDGSPHPLRSAHDGAAVVCDGRGRYTEATMRENVFIGANAFGTAVTTQAGLSATTPALTLYNPVGSGVLLSVLNVTVNMTAEPAAITDLCLAYNAKNATAPATTTDATMACARLGSTAAPKGRCYRVATLAAAPVACRMLGACDTGLTAAMVINDDVGGAILLEEGVALSIQTRTAAVLVASFTWEEIAKP